MPNIVYASITSKSWRLRIYETVILNKKYNTKMNKTLETIIDKFECFSELNDSERKIIQDDLLLYASENSESFIESISHIQPKKESVLFEVYESLSFQPEKWNDFIISEFDRIENITKKSKRKNQKFICFPLQAISFFARQKFEGNEKLISRIKKGTLSVSNEIIKISIDLLSDIYLMDKLRYNSCRQDIFNLTNSKSSEIKKYAEETIREFDNPIVEKKKIKLYSIYSFIIFIVGLSLSILSISNFNKTFISIQVVIVTFFIFALTFWILHKYLTRTKSVKKSENLNLALGFGFIGCFLLFFVNNQSQKNNFKEEKYQITTKGILAKGEDSDCNSPYIWFTRKGEDKKIIFSCSEHKAVENAKYIELTIKKGLLGFDIMTDKKLKK